MYDVIIKNHHIVICTYIYCIYRWINSSVHPVADDSSSSDPAVIGHLWKVTDL